MTKKLFFMAIIGLVPFSAAAEGLDTGDTSWLLTSTALVLFMTLPGLALFYAGLVRSKNAVSVNAVFRNCLYRLNSMGCLWL